MDNKGQIAGGLLLLFLFITVIAGFMLILGFGFNVILYLLGIAEISIANTLGLGALIFGIVLFLKVLEFFI